MLGETAAVGVGHTGVVLVDVDGAVVGVGHLGRLAVLLDVGGGALDVLDDGGDLGVVVEGAVLAVELVPESTFVTGTRPGIFFVTVREFSERGPDASGRHGPPCPAVGESEGEGLVRYHLFSR